MYSCWLRQQRYSVDFPGPTPTWGALFGGSVYKKESLQEQRIGQKSLGAGPRLKGGRGRCGKRRGQLTGDRGM